jgi:hypothetical protein
MPTLTFQQIAAASAVVFYLMRWMKTQEWYQNFVTSFPAADRWVYRGVAIVLSLITSIGITSIWQADPNTGGWILTLNIPSPEALWNNFSTINWATIFGAQQVIYDATRRPAAMPHDTSADA